jgi:hypothetical protein
MTASCWARLRPADMARWWRPSPTPASWACRCWWPCWGAQRRRPGHRDHHGGHGDHHLAVHRAVAAGRRRHARRGGARCSNALKGMLSNPMPWSILLGALASALQLRAARPGGKDRGHAGRRRLAGGAVHHRRGAGALADEPARRTPPCRCATTCRWPLIKLLVHPLLVLAGGRAAIALGCRWTVCADGDGAAGGAAQRQQCVAAGRALWRHNGRIARIILVSTARRS